MIILADAPSLFTGAQLDNWQAYSFAIMVCTNLLTPLAFSLIAWGIAGGQYKPRAYVQSPFE